MPLNSSLAARSQVSIDPSSVPPVASASRSTCCCVAFHPLGSRRVSAPTRLSRSAGSRRLLVAYAPLHDRIVLLISSTSDFPPRHPGNPLPAPPQASRACFFLPATAKLASQLRRVRPPRVSVPARPTSTETSGSRPSTLPSRCWPTGSPSDVTSQEQCTSWTTARSASFFDAEQPGAAIAGQPQRSIGAAIPATASTSVVDSSRSAPACPARALTAPGDPGELCGPMAWPCRSCRAAAVPGGLDVPVQDVKGFTAYCPGSSHLHPVAPYQVHSARARRTPVPASDRPSRVAPLHADDQMAIFAAPLIDRSRRRNRHSYSSSTMTISLNPGSPLTLARSR